MDARSPHYTVLARRFRPQSFGEVVGQEHVARALQNAIQSGRVAHAYLFTGARGVGKTSTARILAKSLNCPNTRDGIPCNDCDVCHSISAGHDVDVQEIDGASNRGIDDIRSLRANVNVKSMRTKFKIYIIDEVHMLTKEAFNALLKTLEEPPPNVKFVFCTTEPNKLPDTILSRCQRFDFGTIATSSIIGRLGQIAETEGKEVTPEALELVARRAAGSMRDSQSLFDQLLAFGDDRITAEDVHRLLGTAGDDRLLEILEALIGGERAAVLHAFDEALEAGVQLGELTDQLLNLLRDVMVVAAGADRVELMGVTESHRDTLKRHSDRWGLSNVVAALQILADTKSRMQRATHGRALAELALIRICLLEDLEGIEGLVERLQGAGNQTVPAPTGRPGRTAGSSAGNGATSNARNRDPEPAPEPPADDAGQKKTLDSDDGHNLGRVEFAKSVSVADFVEGQEQEILSQIICRLEDMLKDSVKRASGVAILGPNRLDLQFPARYSFHKQYCERLDELKRLEQLAEQVTGQPVRVTCSLVETGDANPPERSPGTGQGKAEASRKMPDFRNDEFVQQALAVFGGSVERIVPLAEAPTRKE